MGISQFEMTEIRNHKDLRIWQQGISLVEEIYKVTHLFPADENKNALLQEIEVLGKMTNKLISTLNN